MHFGSFRECLVLAASLVSCSAIQAVPITWAVSAYAPSAQPVPGIGGWFTYDAATGQMLAWNLHFGTAIDAGFISQYPCNNYCGNFTASSTNGEFDYYFIGGQQALGHPLAEVDFALGLPLIDSGGSIALLPGSSFVGIYQGMPGQLWLTFPITQGSINGVPEPAGYFYATLPLLAFVLAVRHRKNGRSGNS